jgi:hypothetical protein
LIFNLKKTIIKTSIYIFRGEFMKKLLFTITLMGMILFLFFASCKTSEEASQYTLTVTTTTGVSGTPTAGTYTHSANDLVTYNYSISAGYKNLRVTLDGVPQANSGTVTITGNHILAASAENFDIRGKWEGKAYSEGSPSDFVVTFSGQILSGTLSGKVAKLAPNFTDGDYTVSGNEVNFTLVYGNNEGFFRCTGTFTDENHMSGTWEYEDSSGLKGTGTWNLERS